MDTKIKDLYALSKYAEWYALKHELDLLIKSFDDITDMDIDTPSRISVEAEVAGRKYARKKILMFLQKMKLWEKDPSKPKIDPYE